MKRTQGMLVIFIILTLMLGMLEFTKVRDRDLLYDKKVEASLKLSQIFNRVKQYRLEIDGVIDKSIDINETGMIGLNYSEITTTLGSLESKRTSANPNSAAMVVELMSQAGLQKGDTIAVNVSGSFPALNFAVLAAADALDVNTIMIASVGASTYGANHKLLTYIDMEKRLFEEGIITRKSVAFSFGGENDLGTDIDQNALSKVKDRHTDKDFISIENYEDNIKYRLDIYDRYSDDIDLFINVGGNIVSGEKTDIGFEVQNGYINPNVKLNFKNKGLIGVFLSRGVGVINLINIKKIAMQYGLSIDPAPIPDIATEDIYYTYIYDKGILIAIVVFANCFFIGYGYRRRKENHRKISQTISINNKDG